MCASSLPRIWLIGGTSEGLRLAQLCSQAQVPCTVSVTTAAAGDRYPHQPTLRVRVTRLTPLDLPMFLRSEAIAGILDASHPHAQAISALAMRAAAQYDLPYLRFERAVVDPAVSATEQVIAGLPALLEGSLLEGKRVMLTLGSRTLSAFTPWQHRCTLYARILPSLEALQAALTAGFPSERLVALRPPVSYGLELALWQQWGIELAVTKASGQPGGEAIKRQVAAALNIPLVVIARPPLTYPQQTDELQTALAFCQQVVATTSPHGPADGCD